LAPIHPKQNTSPDRWTSASQPRSQPQGRRAGSLPWQRYVACLCLSHTWWFIPLSKRVITPVISG
jgi:hypothetical protein